MVTTNMLRTHEGKKAFSDKKNFPFVTNQKPYTGQITEIAPYMRTYI